MELIVSHFCLQADVYTDQSGGCVAFLSNVDSEKDKVVTFQSRSYDLPAWSVSILPDCKNVAFNTAKVFDFLCQWSSELQHALLQKMFFLKEKKPCQNKTDSTLLNKWNMDSKGIKKEQNKWQISEYFMLNPSYIKSAILHEVLFSQIIVAPGSSSLGAISNSDDGYGPCKFGIIKS
jgi:hypothetical protein